MCCWSGRGWINAGDHHAQRSRPFFRQHRRRPRLDFLPPYSPELNPLDRVWKLLRTRATHNQYFAELDELVSAVTQQLAEWSKPNRVLAKLCCVGS